jgi:ABC-type amino acid transport substrate-binding protein
MQRTISLIALCAAIGCGGENGAGTDFAQSHHGRAELAPDTFVPDPCANNPIGNAWDPDIGLPSSAALNQLSPSGTKLRIGIATTNLHYATLDKSNNPVGPAIDISCRLAVKLNLPIEFTTYADLPSLTAAFQAGAFEIGWAFDPLLADTSIMALATPYVSIPNTYAVLNNSPFQYVADVDVSHDPQYKVGTATGNSTQVYLAQHLNFAKLIKFTGTGAQTALLANPPQIDAVASGRAALTTFVTTGAGKDKARILPDNIFFANLAPFMHLNNPDGVCYLSDYLEAAKTSGLVLQALSRITPSVLDTGSTVSPALPTCTSPCANPIGSAWDPVIGKPSAAALKQLAPDDVLTVAINTGNGNVGTFNANTGVISGTGVDLACRLAAQLGLPLQLIKEDQNSLATNFPLNKWNIGIAANSVSSSVALLSPPPQFANSYIGVEVTYVVAMASTIKTVADVDNPGVKIGYVIGSAADNYLHANVKFATLQGFATLGAAQTSLKSKGGVTTVITGRPALVNFVTANPTFRVLSDYAFFDDSAPFMHQGNQDAVCFLSDYVEAAKTSGLIAQAIVRTAALGSTAGRRAEPALPTCAPNARCKSVTVMADGTCRAAASIDSGSDDADSDANCIQSPAGPFGLGVTNATLTCTDNAGNTSVCSANVTVVDTTPPVIACPADQTLECTDEGAVASFAPTATDNCGIAKVTCSPPSGTKFPEDLSPTLSTCTAVDGSGNAASCSFQVKVQDTLPPVVTTNPGDENGFIASLWPPNHSLHTISLSDCIASITDQCDGSAPATIVRVTSDELVKTHGKKGEDMVIVDGQIVQLRAERDGSGDGRVYTIFADVTDDDGNTTEVACKVQVPHDQSGAPAVDSGAVSCMGQGCP